MKWSKRLESLTEKGEFSPQALPVSGCSPHKEAGCLLALAGQYNPPTGFCHKLYEVTTKLQSRPPHWLCTGHVIHSYKHTVVSKIQQKMCLLGEQRTRAPSILTLFWRIPDKPPRWKIVAEPRKMPGFLAFGGEEFNLGPEMRLDHSELLCNKVY